MILCKLLPLMVVVVWVEHAICLPQEPKAIAAMQACPSGELKANFAPCGAESTVYDSPSDSGEQAPPPVGQEQPEQPQPEQQPPEQQPPEQQPPEQQPPEQQPPEQQPPEQPPPEQPPVEQPPVEQLPEDMVHMAVKRSWILKQDDWAMYLKLATYAELPEPTQTAWTGTQTRAEIYFSTGSSPCPEVMTGGEACQGISNVRTEIRSTASSVTRAAPSDFTYSEAWNFAHATSAPKFAYTQLVTSNLGWMPTISYAIQSPSPEQIVRYALPPWVASLPQYTFPNKDVTYTHNDAGGVVVSKTSTIICTSPDFTQLFV